MLEGAETSLPKKMNWRVKNWGKKKTNQAGALYNQLKKKNSNAESKTGTRKTTKSEGGGYSRVRSHQEKKAELGKKMENVRKWGPEPSKKKKRNKWTAREKRVKGTAQHQGAPSRAEEGPGDRERGIQITIHLKDLQVQKRREKGTTPAAHWASRRLRKKKGLPSGDKQKREGRLPTVIKYGGERGNKQSRRLWLGPKGRDESYGGGAVIK